MELRLGATNFEGQVQKDSKEFEDET